MSPQTIACLISGPSGETVSLPVGPLFHQIGPRVSLDKTFSKTQRSDSNEHPLNIYIYIYIYISRIKFVGLQTILGPNQWWAAPGSS